MGTIRVKGRILLYCGYVTYAAVALASVTRNLGDWYRVAGSWILQAMPQEITTPWGTLVYFCQRPDPFVFMDGLLEESIELLAVSLLLSAVLVHYLAYRGQ